MRRFLLLFLFSLAACRESKQPPVILISIDTLRSDRLPMYGYRGVETPALDALRADSVLYSRAYSHCPLTLPSHASMLTGLLPAEHGIRDNIGFTLPSKIPTAAEVLKKSGYATGAAVSAFVLRRETGIARGFDWFDDEVEPIGPSQVIARVQRDGRDTIRAATNWLDEPRANPFFLFVHLYEPHSPYTPPEPFRSRYRDAYDGEIAYTDQLIGELVGYLKRKELYDDALIVVLSDHGEGLNDHGEEEHGIFLYREAIQVPLLVKLPRSRRSGETIETPAQLADVFTMLTTRALPPDAPPDRVIYSESFYPKLHFGWSDLHSVVRGDRHFIRAPQPELYDLARDPGEKRNVIADDRRSFVQLRAAIEPYVREAAKPAAIDPEEARKLAALGYVGSAVTTQPGEVLPDPKATIGTFRDIRLAFTLFRDLELAKARELTERLLRENRRIVDLWDLQAKILLKLGDTNGAIEAAKEGLRVSSSATALALMVANLATTTGDLDDARRHAELVLTTEPGQANDVLARIALQEKDYAKAEQHAKIAIEKSHEPAAAMLTMGLIRKQQDDLSGALAWFDRAAQAIADKRNRRLPNLHLYRADVLARLGRNAEAEREFRAEIAAFPTEPDAYAGLILLLTANGRVDEATKLVFTLVETAPTPPSYLAVSETLRAIGDERGARYWAMQGLRRYPENRELRGML